MARNMRCAPFIAALREADWKLRYDSKAGGVRTVEFYKFFGQREVNVQLWGDGKHRASNMIYSDRAKRSGRASTNPTEFQSIDGMWQAIMAERFRSDHPPA